MYTRGRVITDCIYDNDCWIENNGYPVEDLAIDPNWTDKQIANYLFDKGLIYTNDLRRIVIENLGDGFEICKKKSWLPLFYCVAE